MFRILLFDNMSRNTSDYFNTAHVYFHPNFPYWKISFKVESIVFACSLPNTYIKYNPKLTSIKEIVNNSYKSKLDIQANCSFSFQSYWLFSCGLDNCREDGRNRPLIFLEGVFMLLLISERFVLSRSLSTKQLLTSLS